MGGRGETADQAPLFTVTDKARTRVLQLRAGEADPERLALWIEVIGANSAEFAYDMYFQAASEAAADDVLIGHDDLTVVIPVASADQLRGATLEVSRDLLNPGMVMNNPNRPPGAASPAIAGPPAELSGDTAQRVQQVLEQQINPSIAAHGGRADLVAVEGSTAYLRLGGGCQGCGMASVTLSQGIEVAIQEAVPEITQVIDVTDHAGGTNPYYEAAKK
jgi:Fe/S biogenesis protein NfuA